MSELYHAEKGTPERNAVAAQLRFIRRVERANEYTTDRSLPYYVLEFEGLKHFLSYVHEVNQSNVVLDVGSGKSIALAALAKSSIGDGLKFLGTGLVRHPEVDRHIGNNHYRITSGEVLRGIPNNSIAGILALFSVAYSASPELVIKKFDEVLVPGGAIKGVFRSHNSNPGADLFNRTGCKNPDQFVEALKKLGYDVSTNDNYVFSTMIAIKPGGSNPNMTAEKILRLDRREFKTASEVFMPKKPHELNRYVSMNFIKKSKIIFERENIKGMT